MAYHKGYSLIFAGLLFILFDIRFGRLDIPLPDVLGYLMAARGLNGLAAAHPGFPKARNLALVLALFSLIDLYEIKMTPAQASHFRHQTLVAITDKLEDFLPEQVLGIRRIGDPVRDQGRITAKYEDGTKVVINRHPSPTPEALRILFEEKYSFEAMMARYGRGGEEKAGGGHGQSGANGKITAVEFNMRWGDHEALLWWHRGWTWWNPVSWNEKGGWSRDLVFIIEGHPDTADEFRAVLEGRFAPVPTSGFAVTVHPLLPLPGLLSAGLLLMIWWICGAIVDLARRSEQNDLESTAARRRRLYLYVKVASWGFTSIWMSLLLLLPNAAEPVLGLPFVVGAGAFLVASVVVSFLLLGLLMQAVHRLGEDRVNPASC